MSQQPAPAPPGGVEIIINGHIEGEGIAIGPGAQAHVVKNYYQAKISDTQVQRVVAEVEAKVLAQIKLLDKAGFRPEVAPLPGRAEQVSVRDPFALPVGISPVPGRIASADAQQWQQQIAPLDQSLRQLDQRLSATVPGERCVARELLVGQQRVNLVELLIQQGNLAFWSFRQEAARLFADQVSAYYLAHPAWPDLPPIHIFHDAALSNLEIRRAWVLYQKYRLHSPAMTGPHLAQLSQGRWREVLQAWFSAKLITAEAFQYERSYLKAIGERYDPQAVRNAAQQAEACFADAVRRQPDNSIALVNWGAIKAETALFFSIENGALDQARLQGAQALFAHAEGQLGQRHDREGQIALGLALFHDATRLPPDANLGAVQWAAQHTQQMRQEWPQAAAQQAIQWEMVQRNWARRDARFFDEQKARRAREILVAAGAAALLFLLDEKLTAHAQMLQQIARWTSAAAPGQPPQPPKPPVKVGRGISRRAFLRVGIGAGTVVVAGGAAAIAVKAGLLPPHSAASATPTTGPTATFTPPARTPGMLIASHRHRDRVTGLSWSPGGSASLRGGYSRASGGGLRIASASQDGTVDVWDAASGQTLTTYTGHSGPVLAVAWSPDGSLIASGGMDRLVQFWDPTTGKTISTYSGHDGAVYSLAWSPDSQRLASGGTLGQLVVIDVNQQATGSLRGGFDVILALAWSQNGQYLVSGGGYSPNTGLADGGTHSPLAAASGGDAGLVIVWDASGGKPLAAYRNHPSTVLAVACSPDNTRVVSGSADAEVWDITSGTPSTAYKNHTSSVNALDWARDAQRIASGSADQTVQVWRASDGSNLFTYTQHSAPVNAVAWSPDQKAIASGSDDQTAQIWVAP